MVSSGRDVPRTMPTTLCEVMTSVRASPRTLRVAFSGTGRKSRRRAAAFMASKLVPEAANNCAARSRWIQRDLAAQLFAASGTSFDAMKAAARRRDFRPVPLKATLNVRGDARTEVITSHNVVGIVRGTSRPDETILY